MTIKAVIDSDQFGELEESTQGLYKEGEDGKYVLDVDGVDDLPSVKVLKGGMQNAKKERAEAKKLADSLKRRFGPLVDIEDLDLSDVDPDRIEGLRPYLTGEAELPTGDKKDGERKTPEELERIRQNARKPLENDLKKYQGEAQRWQTIAESTLINNALRDEFTRAGVKDPDFLELLVERYRGKCKLDFDDDKPKVVMDSEYGEVTPKEFSKEWAGTDYAKKFIGAPENAGGGAGGGGGGGKEKNPWDPANRDLEEQGRIYKENPERARQMAAKFGKTLR